MDVEMLKKMGGEEVKLVGAWFSPFVLRVEWALKMKGIEYEFVAEEDLMKKSHLLVENNPIYKTVPVLLHAHKPILESLLIVEYIDETWNHLHPIILPQDPYEKATAKFWAKFIEEKLTEPIRNTLVLEGEAQEKKVKQAKDALEIIERDGKVVMVGDKIGLVDITLGWIAIWLPVVEETACVDVFDPEKYPTIFKWMTNFMGLPVIKENVPPRDKLVTYFANFRQFALAQAATK